MLIGEERSKPAANVAIGVNSEGLVKSLPAGFSAVEKIERVVSLGTVEVIPEA